MLLDGRPVMVDTSQPDTTNPKSVTVSIRDKFMSEYRLVDRQEDDRGSLSDTGQWL